MKKLILRNFQAVGDIVMLTSAVRDLHQAHPNKFLTDVRTPFSELWEFNPYITPLDENDPEVEVINCEYPNIHQSNTKPMIYVDGFTLDLEQKLGLRIPVGEYKGDIHLAEQEKLWFSRVREITGDDIPYWVIVAGGKNDFTIKWWDFERFQEIVDHFKGRIMFVQVGAADHQHPPLRGVINQLGKTNLRQLIHVVYHSQGVLSPITSLMHLAAAVEVKSGMPKSRACVVVAGGREPSQWASYPSHQFIHTNGALRCCDLGGCWKSRTVPIGDEHDNPDALCVDVVKKVHSDVHPHAGSEYFLPRCMDMITTQDVIRRIEMYFEGGANAYLTPVQWTLAEQFITK